MSQRQRQLLQLAHFVQQPVHDPQILNLPSYKSKTSGGTSISVIIELGADSFSVSQLISPAVLQFKMSFLFKASQHHVPNNCENSRAHIFPQKCAKLVEKCQDLISVMEKSLSNSHSMRFGHIVKTQTD